MKFFKIRAGEYEGYGLNRYAHIQRQPDGFWGWTLFIDDMEKPFSYGGSYTLSEAKAYLYRR